MSSTRALLCSDRSRDPSLPHDGGQPLHRLRCTAWNLADASRMAPHSMQPVLQDPFAYYKALQDTDAPPSNSANEAASVHDGYACHTGGTGAQNVYGIGAQQTRARALPYHLTARFTDRANGAPLATIIEQSSYSTLNSRGSLLSVGRLPTLSIVESPSPNRSSRRSYHWFDENRLHRNEEGPLLEEDKASALKAHATSQDCRQPHAVVEISTPMALSPDLPQSPRSKIGDADQYANDSKTQGFLRGVLQNARTASHTRSRSSSLTHTPVLEVPEPWPEPSSNDKLRQVQETHGRSMAQETCPRNCKAPLSTESSSPSTTPSSVCQARSRKTSLTSVRPHDSRTSHSRINVSLSQPLEHSSAVQTVPHLPPPSRSLDQTSSVRLVPPEPRDVAAVGATAQAAAFSNGHNDSTPISIPCYGDPARNYSASSLGKHDYGKGASRNASFCSTLSTSYSGTVLGVDLDLQYEGLRSVRRSSSPMPVLFTSQMAELECLAFASGSPEDEQAEETNGTCRSITSSALTSLLPIAAASGIVQPNYDTPKISFYSPSGNLIQPEESSSPDTCASPANPKGTAISHQSSSNKHPVSPSSRTACLPPSRPLLLATTTPPTTVANLPYHLRHYHNYQHPERSMINSCESLINLSPSIKGCGGIVRMPSLTLRSGILNTSPRRIRTATQHKHRRSLRSYLHDLHSDASFYKSRYTALVAQTIGPSSQKKSKKKSPKTLHKQHMTSKRHAASADHTSVARERSSPDQKRKASVGPLAGHALRICFCQPYDGAGKRTRADASCTRWHVDGRHRVEHEGVEDPRGELDGAARPVSRPRQEKETGRRSTTSRSHDGIGNERVVLK